MGLNNKTSPDDKDKVKKKENLGSQEHPLRIVAQVEVVRLMDEEIDKATESDPTDEDE